MSTPLFIVYVYHTNHDHGDPHHVKRIGWFLSLPIPVHSLPNRKLDSFH